MQGYLQFLDIPAAELQQDIEKNNLNSEDPLKDREGREFEAVPTSFVYYGYQLLMFGFLLRRLLMHRIFHVLPLFDDFVRDANNVPATTFSS